MAPQIVLITGCSSGIGLATATRLAHDQRYSKKYDLEVAVGDALKKTVFILELDITKDDDITAVVHGTLQTHGRIDVLINIAGMAFCDVLERVPREKIIQIFEVNVFGAIRLTQAVLPQMKGRRSGKIITVSSTAGKISRPYCEIYSSTKFALEGFFEGLAVVLRSFDIRVCLIEPGKIGTGLLHGLLEDVKSCSKDESLDPTDRRQLQSLSDAFKVMPGVTPDDVAEAIVTRCLEVDKPVLRHLLPTNVYDVVQDAAADLTGETAVGIAGRSIGII